VPTFSLDIDFTSHACHDVIYCCNGCVEAFFNAAFVCSLIQWYLDFGDCPPQTLGVDVQLEQSISMVRHVYCI
jgi:hypothetical protein